MVDVDTLTLEERRQLLALARWAIEQAVSRKNYQPVDLDCLPPRLREEGSCFVTITEANGDLRGCIGGLEALLPLAVDVCEHAAAAALEDYRFQPVHLEEIPHLHLGISRLSKPKPLAYEGPEDLIARLKPGVDGVVLYHDSRRATFLPQVWHKLPDPSDFLSHLCEKMGVPADFWRQHKPLVEIYHVEEFHE